MKISQRIFSLLEEQGKKQSELAEYTGIPTSTISAWKTRGTSLSAESISAIADFLEVSTDYLLTGKEYQPSISETIQTSPIQYTNTREKEMIYLFRQLSEQNQNKIIGRLECMVEQAQAEENAV
ncbi:MAG: helix-turn-helix domain-containing protein [Ruminococcus flavefaciens]|nr:helix-turn-helix domain-containing protein [Ruminococcus flavefaciens]MCM1229854.1 helix-turn-helix domain-containing protein [Ruminococcus flavefaciens]